jgi:histidinol-phosphate aminotransferase
VSTAAPSGRTATIASMAHYRPRRPPVRVDLSDNTSLFGPPPSARTTLAALSDAQLSRYPTPYADSLCAALATHHGVDQDHVVTGCGSDDVLDSAMRACADAGTSIGVCEPTFSVIPTFAALNELEVRSVDLRRDGSVRAQDLLATKAALYYVCSPNNPTGTCIEAGELRELCEGTRAVVLLDEAYADFAGSDLHALLSELPNLVVVRTLSKAFGLAGLRVGYALGDPHVIGAITASRGPYKVGSVSEAVAVGVLAGDGAWVADRVEEVRSLRAWFTGELRALGFEVLSSAANFVAVLVGDAVGVLERLLAHGVLVRAYPSLPVFGDLVRVTIGPRPLLEEALELLRGEAG